MPFQYLNLSNLFAAKKNTEMCYFAQVLFCNWFLFLSTLFIVSQSEHNQKSIGKQYMNGIFSIKHPATGNIANFCAFHMLYTQNI